MKTKLLTVIVCLFVIISQSSYAQVALKDTREIEGILYDNNNKPYTGEVLNLYSNDKYQLSAFYKNGKKNGKYTEWYENGKKRSEGNYIDGQPVGTITLWHETGKVIMINRFKKTPGELRIHGVLPDGIYEDGPSYIWFNLNGKKTEVKNYKDGLLEGDCYAGAFSEGGVTYDSAITTWNKGNAIKKRIFKNGQLEGKYTEWFENGQPKTECYYSNGKLNGEYKMYGTDGSVLISHYLNGVEDKYAGSRVKDYIAYGRLKTNDSTLLRYVSSPYHPNKYLYYRSNYTADALQNKRANSIEF